MKIIARFKVNQTMYFNYASCYWDKDKPNGKYKEDYDLMKKGAVLEAYKLDEDEYISCDGEICTIECSNGKHSVYFRNLNELYNCEWLDKIVTGIYFYA